MNIAVGFHKKLGIGLKTTYNPYKAVLSPSAEDLEHPINSGKRGQIYFREPEGCMENKSVPFFLKVYLN